MNRQLLFLLFSLFVLLSVSSCKDDDDKVKITAIRLETTSISLFPGEEFQLKVIHSPAEAPAPKYYWYEGEPNTFTAGAIVEVNESGLVKTRIGEGATTVTVITPDHYGRDGEHLSSTCFVTVTMTKATSLTFDKEKYELPEGENVTVGLTATTNNPRIPEYEIPSSTFNQFKWEIEDPQIATIESGIITAVSLGETTLTVIDNYSNLQTSCTIVVSAVEIESVSFEEETIEIENGASKTLDLIILPENATPVEWIWSSSDEEIITVDENGVIKAIKIGTATVKVTSMDGKHTIDIVVTSFPAPVTGIRIDYPSTTKFQIDTPYQLSAKVIPENAHNQNYKWKIVEGNASIDENGVFIGYQKEKVKICAISEDGGFQDYLTIEVVDIEDLIEVEFIIRSLTQQLTSTQFIFNSKISFPTGVLLRFYSVYLVDNYGYFKEFLTPNFSYGSYAYISITSPYYYTGNIIWDNHPYKGWRVVYQFSLNGKDYEIVKPLDTSYVREFW